MVGGGHVAQRRVPGLLAAGAVVTVVSPEATPAIEALADAGEVRWERRGFEDRDLDDAWYVVAATDDPTPTRPSARPPRRDGSSASAPTTPTPRRPGRPAVGATHGVTVAVLGNRDPRRRRRVRDEILDGLREGTIAAPHHRDRTPGVVLVGGGPGDPELISVAGRKALMEADVVVADRLAPRELLGELPATTELVDVAKIPRGRSAAAGGDQPAHRRARARRASGWCGSRAATASSSAAATRRCWPAARPACR